MATEYQDMWAEVYTIIGAKTTSSTISLDNLVKPMLNDLEEQICEWLVYDELTDKMIKSGDFRPRARTAGINAVPDTNLTAALVVDGTTAYLNTANFLSAWYLCVDRNIIQYTSKASDHVLGVTGIDISHDSGRSVKQAFLIPAAAVDTINVWDVTNDHEVEYIDYRDDTKLPFYYSIFPNNESDTSMFIVFFGISGGFAKQFRILYQEEFTPMVDDDDESNLPGSNGLTVTAMIVAGSIMIKTNYDYNRWVTILRKWYGNLVRMYSKFAKIKKWFKDKIKVKPFYSYYGRGPRSNYVTKSE